MQPASRAARKTENRKLPSGIVVRKQSAEEQNGHDVTPVGEGPRNLPNGEVPGEKPDTTKRSNFLRWSMPRAAKNVSRKCVELSGH